MVLGILPDKLFVDRSMRVTVFKLPISADTIAEDCKPLTLVGMTPVNSLSNRLNIARLLNLPISSGIFPWILHLHAANISREVEKLPIEAGSFPLRRFSPITNLFKLRHSVKEVRKVNSEYGD
ncbi:unnamed protein product [Fraxinus pennsylvanica]|uniref:Uncharacterized protein n=1 Tax=Fraxinus pennsylvanica TaxID=56036 RepID=A0AAD2AK70_9LAMI|nr:unnamed protein product [Fraxinus pennsylvanica]